MRIEGWEQRFHAKFTEAQGREFQWGKHDCVLFAADIVEALTGIDHAAEFRGRYRTPRGALRIVGNLETFPDQYFKRIPVTRAQRGDLVFVDGDNPFGGSLGVVAPGGVQIATAGENGLDLVSIRRGSAAWKVE